jgi:hypothetical protein
MTTVHTMTKFSTDLEAAGFRLAPLCGHISSLEAGAMQSVKASTGKLALNLRGHVGCWHSPI